MSANGDCFAGWSQRISESGFRAEFAVFSREEELQGIDVTRIIGATQRNCQCAQQNKRGLGGDRQAKQSVVVIPHEYRVYLLGDDGRQVRRRNTRPSESSQDPGQACEATGKEGVHNATVDCGKVVNRGNPIVALPKVAAQRNAVIGARSGLDIRKPARRVKMGRLAQGHVPPPRIGFLGRIVRRNERRVTVNCQRQTT